MQFIFANYFAFVVSSSMMGVSGTMPYLSPMTILVRDKEEKQREETSQDCREANNF
jgi:hypothetical protein